MKTLATLEADLWLAQRANRRNPSDENLATIQAIEAEIAILTAESADTSGKIQSQTSPGQTPAKSTGTQGQKEAKNKQSTPKKKESEAK